MAQVRVWPVKSMGGGTPADAGADERGLAGDRAYGLLDLRPRRTRSLITARGIPGLLRWSASYDEEVVDADDPPLPVLTDPRGRAWRWDDSGLASGLAADLGQPVALIRDPLGLQDLSRSMLVTTVASVAELPRRYGAPLELERWRTNLHLDLPDLLPFGESGWEGLRLQVGQVVLRLLHPCGRCAIPAHAPDGSTHDRGLLRWLLGSHDGTLGINARVESPGVLREGAPVRLLDAPRSAAVPKVGRRTHPRGKDSAPAALPPGVKTS